MSWDERSRKTGQYKRSMPCDGCGKPVGEKYFTDNEVCGGSDGPGVYVCRRKRCAIALDGLGVEERRTVYTHTRAMLAAREPKQP